ncbi:YibE/F family protein [Patescibacteria group bacterium]|nr:YibE/F family protein [Patescibacteria group bacterium]
MKTKILLVILLFAFFAPSIALAQNTFKAEIIEINDQQIMLKSLDSEFSGEEIISNISEYDIISMPDYKTGDKVLVNYSQDVDNNDVFYVLDHVRTESLYWLALLFAIVVIAVGRFKGFRALIVLGLTFFIILEFIIPKILEGNNPLLISIIGSLFILILSVYITEGLKRNSSIAIFAIIISLVITGLLSVWFSAFAKLTGFASEEAMYILDIAEHAINIKGLLLAGIIIGALGVLDDVVISQVALIEELKSANPDLPKNKLYSKAMKVGVSHLSSMVNTLFLAYAGVALPLLILFSIHQGSSVTAGKMINNEMIATEIVRALTGSIGIVLAVPIATLLAVNFIKQKKSTPIKR